MVKNMTMKRINVYEAKTHLSRYLGEVERGEVVVVCRRNVPIAELRSLRTRPAEPRPVGRAEGRFHVPESFFDPLPEDVLGAFSGERE